MNLQIYQMFQVIMLLYQPYWKLTRSHMVLSSTIQANKSKSPINSSLIYNGSDSNNEVQIVNEPIISAINTNINKTPVEEQIITYRKCCHSNYINERINSENVTMLQTNEQKNIKWPIGQ